MEANFSDISPTKPQCTRQGHFEIVVFSSPQHMLPYAAQRVACIVLHALSPEHSDQSEGQGNFAPKLSKLGSCMRLKKRG